MSQHFIEICKGCGTVIKQCKCPGSKTVTYSLCIKCKAHEKALAKK